MQTLRLADELQGPLARGHPWVYRDRLPRHALATGEWVRVEAGSASAVGLFDGEGPIAVRLFSRRALPDRAWFEASVAAALALRAQLPESGTDAYRLINGEGDGLPGVVVDRYGRHAVLRVYAEGVRPAADEVVRALAGALRLRGISERSGEGLQRSYGQLPPPELTVRENGLQLLANLHQGQKTGLFLDQRDNRLTVRRLAAGRSVLNLFAYNGGFSLAALAGGAATAISVDAARAALADAERAVAMNGFEAGRHETVAADVFDFLAQGSERRFDLVVCDPPSLARGKRGRHAALRAYRRLNSAAMGRVASGGLLATGSCTAQVSPEDFRAVLAEAASEAGVTAQIVHEAGQPVDHPVPVGFPEGRYLKFLILRLNPVA